jgi:hypothetical protein
MNDADFRQVSMVGIPNTDADEHQITNANCVKSRRPAGFMAYLKNSSVDTIERL